MSKFLEYVNSKNKITKPVVDASGDQIDPKSSPVKPPKAKNRYKPGVLNPKTPNKNNWADMGEKNLIYKPDLKNSNGCTPAKIPTAEQVQQSNAFIASILQDPSLIETFVRQLKASGIFGAIVAEVFDHRETAYHLSEILAHETYGPKLHKTLIKALNEEVSKPFGDQLQDGDDDEEDDNDPFKDEDEDTEDDEDEDGSGNSDLDVSHEGEGEENQDPSMDPNMMGQGMDPSMQGLPPMPPVPNKPMNPMMNNMPTSMMKAYQKAMMRANMNKR